MSSKLTTIADSVNNLVLGGFPVLDRDPQIALVDLAYEDANAAQYQSIVSLVTGGGIYGSVHLTSNFSAAAVKIRPALLGSARRARDDQALVRYGNDASSITVYEPTFISFVKQTVSLGVDAVPVNAFGQTIILPLEIRSVPDPGIVSVKNDGLIGPFIHGLRVGSTNLTLFSGLASASIMITVDLPSLTLQTSGTKPDVDGTFSGSESIIINSYVAAPRSVYELLQLSASVNSEGMKPKRLSVSIEISSNPDDDLGINYGNHYGGDAFGYVAIRVGSDRWKSASAYVTAYDYINNSIAVTFSAGPHDSSGQPGTISGSFVGFFSLFEYGNLKR